MHRSVPSGVSCACAGARTWSAQLTRCTWKGAHFMAPLTDCTTFKKFSYSISRIFLYLPSLSIYSVLRPWWVKGSKWHSHRLRKKGSFASLKTVFLLPVAMPLGARSKRKQGEEGTTIEDKSRKDGSTRERTGPDPVQPQDNTTSLRQGIMAIKTRLKETPLKQSAFIELIQQ